MLFTTRVVCMCVGDLSLAVNFSGSVQNHDLNRRSGLWLAIRTITRAESAFKKNNQSSHKRKSRNQKTGFDRMKLNLCNS